MAYNESSMGGSGGHNFRVFINSIRVEKGNAAQNYERWRAEGGVKRVTGGTRYWNLNNVSTYNVQLGLNGVTKSGSFAYDFGGSAGQQYAWGTSTTTVNRSSSGGGRGFTSRMDVNLQNSPFLTSGWVTVGGNIDTVNRFGKINSFSPNSGWTDETSSIRTDITKYAGRATLWFRFNNISTSNTTMRKVNVSDPYTWSGFQSWVQSQLENKKSDTLSIYYGDDLDSNGSIEKYTQYTRTMSIANDQGQANPTFADFDYEDTDATALAITGDDQVLIQGKSNLEVTVDSSDAATTNKQANRSDYSFTIGGYSSSEAWPSSGNVVKDIGIVSDVTGTQDLSVRAIDSRGNSTTVTKQVEILPYADPAFYVGLKVSYSNDFDRDDGLDIELLDDNGIGFISPLRLDGTDLNSVTPVTGLRFDMAYSDNGYTGTWVNIPFTVEEATGAITVDKAALEAQILAKMNTIGAGLSLGEEEYNTERWYVLFELEDVYGPQYSTEVIDVGRPFFRIGADGRLYYKEIEFFETFSGKSDFYYPSLQAYSGVGDWVRIAAGGYLGGWTILVNADLFTGGSGVGADGDSWTMDMYVPAGVYFFTFYFFGNPRGGLIDIDVNGNNLISQFDTYFAGGNTSSTAISPSVNVLDGSTYTIEGIVNGRNASNTEGWVNGLVGIKAERVGDL